MKLARPISPSSGETQLHGTRMSQRSKVEEISHYIDILAGVGAALQRWHDRFDQTYTKENSPTKNKLYSLTQQGEAIFSRRHLIPIHTRMHETCMGGIKITL